MYVPDHTDPPPCLTFAILDLLCEVSAKVSRPQHELPDMQNRTSELLLPESTRQ